MVLTNTQRRDLHAGIYEYLLAQGPAFEDAALALAEADPSCVRENVASTPIDENNAAASASDDVSVSSRFSLRSSYSTGGLTVSSAASSSALSKIANTPTLERKWTAVPRLQKKILDLEKIIRSNRGMMNSGGGGGMNGSGGKGIVLTGGVRNGEERRMLPRPPSTFELKGHSGVVHCVAIHPTSTVAVSGGEDGMIKVCGNILAFATALEEIFYFN